MRIVDFLDRGAYLHPERTFCIDRETRLSYAQMAQASQRVARSLLTLGASEDSQVGVLAPNGHAVFACLYGIDRAGAIRVPLNCRNAMEENLQILQDFEVDIVLYHSSQLTAARGLQAGLVRPIRFVRIDGEGEGSLAGLCGEVLQPVPDFAYDPLKIVSIYPTGGTTGKPKGVMHTNQNWFTRTANFVACLPMSRPPVHLVVAPLTHGAGSLAISLTAQGAIHVILEGFDATEVMDCIERHAVTHLFLPPTALYMLLAHPGVAERDYRSLCYLVYGAAPSSPDKIEQAISIFGPVLTHSYAQTEALAIAYLRPDEHQPRDERLRQRLRSCGRPCAMTDIRIAASDGSVLPHGRPGEIEVRGAVVMAGYYKNPAATAEVLRDGWLRTGDVGYLDEDGYLYIVDRSKDMIISGGFNVYPAEVERVAAAHEDVQDCAVVGAPDPKWGEAVVLVVQPKPGRTIDVDALRAFCRARLGGVKAPKTIEVWSELPRSTAGKVLKRQVRERLQAGGEHRI